MVSVQQIDGYNASISPFVIRVFKMNSCLWPGVHSVWLGYALNLNLLSLLNGVVHNCLQPIMFQFLKRDQYQEEVEGGLWCQRWV